MLPAAHTTDLRVVTGAGKNVLHEAIEEVRRHPRRQGQQDQKPRLVVARVLADETTERAVIRQPRHVHHSVLGQAGRVPLTEVRT
jgi:hypothetical protein